MAFEMTRWEPVELTTLERQLNQLFGNEKLWMPAMDVEETKDEVLVRAELPGLKKEEIRLQVHGDALVLSGERKQESERNDRRLHIVEREYGQFQRVIQLPAEVDGAQAKAQYEAGVLTIRLPKREEAKPKEISIEVK